jgi:hypothetical protein
MTDVSVVCSSCQPRTCSGCGPWYTLVDIQCSVGMADVSVVFSSCQSRTFNGYGAWYTLVNIQCSVGMADVSVVRSLCLVICMGNPQVFWGIPLPRPGIYPYPLCGSRYSYGSTRSHPRVTCGFTTITIYILILLLLLPLKYYACRRRFHWCCCRYRCWSWCCCYCPLAVATGAAAAAAAVVAAALVVSEPGEPCDRCCCSCRHLRRHI